MRVPDPVLIAPEKVVALDGKANIQPALSAPAGGSVVETDPVMRAVDGFPINLQPFADFPQEGLLVFRDCAIAHGRDVEKIGTVLCDRVDQTTQDRLCAGDGHSSRIAPGAAEVVIDLLLMHERFGKDDPRYWNMFVAQWNWVNKYGIDRENGGWWPRVNNDGTPVRGAKSDAWTECYHQGRSMMNLSERLRKLAGIEH